MPTSPALPPGMHVLERGWLSSNNVVFARGEHPAIVDSGYVTHAAQTLALVHAALDGRPPVILVNTHLHSDHCGGNAALQACYTGLRTLVPPGCADAVARWDTAALSFAPTGQNCDRFKADDVIAPGTVTWLGDRPWQVHAAPGHDPHSVVLYEPATRVLLSADALWSNGFGVVFPELEGEQAFAQVRDTLDLIESLAPAVVVPGHGAVFTDVEEALTRARSRLASFESDPMRHAAHAAKVLLKFKLLELQRTALTEFLQWAQSTPYFALVHRRWFSERPLPEWVRALLADLERSGALRLHQGQLHNA